MKPPSLQQHRGKDAQPAETSGLQVNSGSYIGAARKGYRSRAASCLAETELGSISAVFEKRYHHPHQAQTPQQVEERRPLRDVVIKQNHCTPPIATESQHTPGLC